MTETKPYFRKDNAEGISPPDLSKVCSYAEHIVRARGKRTQYTSVALSPDKIRDFDGILYRLLPEKIDQDKHIFVEHDQLIDSLRQTATTETKADRLRAIQALRYAKQRTEGLVQWQFDVARIPPKEIINWAKPKVAEYFSKVS